MTVVQVVDMIPVWDRDMAASFAVHMIMCNVLVMGRAAHRFSLSVPNFDSWANGAPQFSSSRDRCCQETLRLAAEWGRLSTLCRSPTRARTSAAGHPVGGVGQRAAGNRPVV